MRRLLAICLSIQALLLAGCGGAGSGDRDARRVEIWQAFNPEETEVFREIMEDFEAEYEQRTGTPIEVEIQYVSYNDMFTKLRTAALADVTPDIAFVDAIKVTDLAFGQALVPLNELEAFQSRYDSIADARSEFVGASFDSGIVNRLGVERLYGLPVQTTTVSLFWNRELFRNRSAELTAAGLDPNRAPRDWAELFAYGQVLTDVERGIYAYGAHGSLWFNFPFFNMYNVGFVEYSEEGLVEPDIVTPQAEAALDRILTIVTSGVEGGAWKRSALSPDAGFLNRKYAMILTGPWNVENFTNAGLDFDIALVPGPTREEVERLALVASDPTLVDEIGLQAYTSSNVGGQTGVIMRSAPDPELAYEVLEHFTSEPVQRRWASNLGQIPTRLAAWEDLDTSEYPYLPKFMLQLRTARRIPQIPLYGVLETDIFNPQIDLLLQERLSPGEMLKRMEAQMEDRIVGPINEASRQILERERGETPSG